MKRIEATLLAGGLRVALVATRWHALVVERLIEGARSAFIQQGGDEGALTLHLVPGAFEIPLVAQALARSGRFDAVVCLGAVIRGETDHYRFVAQSATSGIAQAALASGVPVTLGLLTTDTLEQALARAGSKAGNKGSEAMLAAIETANLLKALD